MILDKSIKSAFWFSSPHRALKLKEDPATLDSLGTLYLRQAKLEPARLVYEYMWSKYGDSGSASEERKHVPNTVTPRYADVATIHYVSDWVRPKLYWKKQNVLPTPLRYSRK